LHSTRRNDDLTIELARAYAQAGSLSDAENVLRKALVENPSSFPLTRALVGVLVDEHSLERTFQEPVELAEHYATAHPDHAEAQRLYLQMLVAWVPSGAETGDLTRATPLARKLLARDPEDPYFLYVVGMLERQAGDYAAAKNHLERSIAVDPSDDRPHYELGVVLAALSDAPGAERELRKTLSLGNNRAEVRFQLAKVLRMLGKTDEANQQMKLYSDQTAAASQQRIAALKEGQASQALSAGRNDEAVRLLREATQATPENSSLQFKLGMALDKTGDIAGEQTALEKAVQIDPTLAMAQNQLGYLASRGGDAASAEEHFRRAVEAAPTYTEAWINLAATLGMESKITEAQEAVARALKVDPKNAAALQLQQDLKAVKP
jgi:tetratricopeptide (TPR) repeat protein